MANFLYMYMDEVLLIYIKEENYSSFEKVLFTFLFGTIKNWFHVFRRRYQTVQFF
jgi:hypothetical protein